MPCKEVARNSVASLWAEARKRMYDPAELRASALRLKMSQERQPEEQARNKRGPKPKHDRLKAEISARLDRDDKIESKAVAADVRELARQQKWPEPHEKTCFKFIAKLRAKR